MGFSFTITGMFLKVPETSQQITITTEKIEVSDDEKMQEKQVRYKAYIPYF